MFASGGRDSNIVVWDRRCGPNLRADEIIPAHPSQGKPFLLLFTLGILNKR